MFIRAKAQQKPTRINTLQSGIIAITLGVTFLSPPRAEAFETHLVALQGDRLDGLAPEEVLYDWRYAQGINDAGLVAFLGDVAQRREDGGLTRVGKGLWIGIPGQLRLVAREGESAPGLENESVLADIKDNFAFNNRGEVAFLAAIGPSRNQTEATGLFLGNREGLRLVAKDGDPAVGFESNGGQIEFEPNVDLSHHTRYSLNDTGQLAWTAGIAESSQQGVWLTSDETTTWLSQEEGETISGIIEHLTIANNGSVVFSNRNPTETPAPETLYLRDRTSLRPIIARGDTLNTPRTTISAITDVLFTNDGSLNLTLKLRTLGSPGRPTSIWRWEAGEFHPIHVPGREVVLDLYVSLNANLVSGLSNQVIPFTTCSAHPDSRSPRCDTVLHLIENGRDRTVAYREMPFGPDGATVEFDHVPGLRNPAIITNDHGVAITHLGIRQPDGTLTQGIYRVDGGTYVQIIEAGNDLQIGPETTTSTRYFSLFTRPRSDAPLRALNERNELLLSVHSRDLPKALVVLSLDPPRPFTIERHDTGLQLIWNGDGTLEAASDLSGPWTPLPNQARLQDLPSDKLLQFFRINP